MQLRRGLHASLKWRLLIATSPDHFAKGAIFESSLLRTERGVGLQPAGLRDFRDRRAALASVPPVLLGAILTL